MVAQIVSLIYGTDWFRNSTYVAEEPIGPYYFKHLSSINAYQPFGIAKFDINGRVYLAELRFTEMV